MNSFGKGLMSTPWVLHQDDSHLLHLAWCSLVWGYQGEGNHHLTLQRTLPPNRVVAVFDDILSKEVLMSLRTYMSVFIRWELEPSSQECVPAEQDEGNVNCGATSGPSTRAPWIGHVDPECFAQSQTWNNITNSTLQCHKYYRWKRFYPYNVRGEMLQRGDSVAPGVVVSSQYSREFALRIFLVPEWQKDDYGWHVLLWAIFTKQNQWVGHLQL